MTIDLAAYRFAVITRDIIYRWERHQENPSDLRFSWDQQLDSQSLETFFNYFKSQVTPHPDFNFNPTQPEFLYLTNGLTITFTKTLIQYPLKVARLVSGWTRPHVTLHYTNQGR